MGFHTFLDNFGRVQFQFSVFQIIKEDVKLKNEITSNLPLDLLISINPKVLKALKSDNEQIERIEKELIELLSREVKNSKIASCFFYPSWILVDNNIEDLLVKYTRASNVTRNGYGTFFSKNQEPMVLYALSNQMRNARWFKQIAFQNSFLEISKQNFEKQIDPNDTMLINTYLDLLDEGRHYFSIKNTRSGVLFFIQVDDDMEPNLIFIK